MEDSMDKGLYCTHTQVTNQPGNIFWKYDTQNLLYTDTEEWNQFKPHPANVLQMYYKCITKDYHSKSATK